MQNYSVKWGAIIGVVVILLIILIQVIIETAIDSVVLFYNVLSGVTVGLVSSIAFRFISLNEEKKISAITLDLEAEESIIIEGSAKYHLESAIYNGKLFLTSNRLIFKSLKLETIEPVFVKPLNSIKNIGLKRNVGIINRSLEITSNLSSDRFDIDYPCDWKSIIENQIKHSQDAETLIS